MINKYQSIIAWLVLAFAISSCDYQEIGDSPDYPEQIIYMPAAYHNLFEIKKQPDRFGDTPTDGDKYRYKIEGDKFLVPLGVYRAGINHKGSFDIHIAVDNDTITNLISEGLDASILPLDTYTFPSEITMPDGESFSGFNLEIDLDYLQNSLVEKYALGIRIHSADRETNPDLEVTLIVIHTEAARPDPE